MGELHELVRRAYPFADLSRAQLENVLDMLAGRYPSDEFAELRPRIIWDRTAGVLRGRPGARRLAVTNAGTIPDRGLFGVFIAGEGGGRVGELDEEMVYEARAGQVIVLGASSWRIEEITRDRVLVSPAPGVPGAVPFWKGEGVGRPYELGEAIGKFARELLAARDPKVPDLDERAERNLIAFLREQEKATGALPSDRTVVVERFRDEIGDWRLCILTPFGARVHAPWAMAVGARLRESLGLEVQSIWSDDGIAFHLPDADSPPATDLLMLDPDELEELVLAEVGQTALFGARFRENAARALLIPRRRPGERTPLWQQRLKAQGLLQVARKYSSFPIVLETYRECLQDVFDLPALKRLLGRLRARELDLVDVETASASPFASSLLFDYIATYMYEDDTPPAERRAQALSLDRDLLRELLGQEELRELIDPAALAEVEASLRPFPRDPERLYDLLAPARRPAQRRVRRGARGDPRSRAACDPRPHRRRGAPRGGGRCGPVSRRARGRALVGPARPCSSSRCRTHCARSSPAGRAGAGRSPRPRRRRGSGSTSRRSSEVSSATEKLVRGELRPGGSEREWCDPDVLRRLRRASLAALRREVEPVEQAALGRFLSSWHGIDRRASLREALIPLQALALPVALWEAEVLPRRVPDYRPEQLDQLCASGELVWVGAGLDRVAVFFRDDAPLLGRPAGTPLPEGEAHDAIRAALAGGALFWDGLLSATEARRRDGASGALGSRLERRGDERLLVAAAGRTALPAAAARPARAALLPRSRPAPDRDAGTLVARGRALRRGRARPALARGAPARAARHRHPRLRPRPRGSPAATALCTASCARSRRWAPAGAATSWRGSAARSSRSAEPSSACASCGRARTTSPSRSCSPPPIRRSRTAPCCRGRSAPGRARPAWRERTSSCSAASRRSSSSAAAARSSRCGSRTRSGYGPRSRRSSASSSGAARSASRSSASTASR